MVVEFKTLTPKISLDGGKIRLHNFQRLIKMSVMKFELFVFMIFEKLNLIKIFGSLSVFYEILHRQSSKILKDFP